MSVRAVYLSVEAGAAARLAEVDPDDVVAYVEDVQEGGVEVLDLDEAWDGLHYLLTGVSAAQPIEDDPGSEAVVGVYEFESDDLVGLTPLDELPRVVAALETVDVDGLLDAADFRKFEVDEVYPDIWADDPAELRGLLRTAFAELLEFHRCCVADGRDLLVSIY